MEVFGILMFFSALIYGAVELVKHFFPSWEQNVDLEARSWLHDRINALEDDVSSIYNKVHFDIWNDSSNTSAGAEGSVTPPVNASGANGPIGPQA